MTRRGRSGGRCAGPPPRGRWFERAVAIYPGFEPYRQLAGAPTIPLLQLEPRP
jgi:hypothetical protein